VVPALGGLKVTTVQRIVSVALVVILFDGGMHIGVNDPVGIALLAC
jgi:cell volume regulation protein A